MIPRHMLSSFAATDNPNAYHGRSDARSYPAPARQGPDGSTHERVDSFSAPRPPEDMQQQDFPSDGLQAAESASDRPTPPFFLDDIQPEIYQKRPGVFTFKTSLDTAQRLMEESFWTWLRTTTTSSAITSHGLMEVPVLQEAAIKRLLENYLPVLERGFVTLSRFLDDQIRAAGVEWAHDAHACAVARGLRRFQLDFRPYAKTAKHGVLSLDWGSYGLEARVQSAVWGYRIPAELCAAGVLKAAVTIMRLREERERVEADVTAALGVAEELEVEGWSFD